MTEEPDYFAIPEFLRRYPAPKAAQEIDLDAALETFHKGQNDARDKADTPKTRK